MAPTFAQATAIKTIDSHTYSTNLLLEWAVGAGESSQLVMINPELSALIKITV
jgi:hypothetical protein